MHNQIDNFISSKNQYKLQLVGNSGFDRNYHGNGSGYDNKSGGGNFNRNYGE